MCYLSVCDLRTFWTAETWVKWQVLSVFFLFIRVDTVFSQARYSIPEEMTEGSFVGNIAKDLGIELTRLISGKARIVTKGSRQYVDLNRDKGILVVKERIDREELCQQTSPCSFSFEIILESPIQLYRVTVEVRDINDNAPSFPKDNIKLEISESAASGARFSLDSAVDPDVGINAIQSYALKPTDHFKMELNGNIDGSTNLEMILQTPLDRENVEEFTVLLIAIDGGEPQKSGTIRIHITVLDANDNAPVCNKAIYKAEVKENSPIGTSIATINAVDPDKGSNGDVMYSIAHANAEAKQLFTINSETGLVSLTGKLDFEKTKGYHVNIKAKDHGGLFDTCKVSIEVIDENDNAPSIQLMSFSNSIPEDSPSGTTVAVVNIEDADSGKNGIVYCTINTDVPFKIESSLTDYYTLVTDGNLDRETTDEYNITIMATDEGQTKRHSSKTVTIKVSDVNDNSPLFHRDEYIAYITENNNQGVSAISVKADDADAGLNARLTYFLSEKDIGGISITSLVTVNPDTGDIQALRSFDYEQMKTFHFNVTARDGGSPPLNANATVTVHVLDQNDNTPQILYPVQTSSSVIAEIVPRSADVGYLVTKVVAVDVDSGQNAWLSYKLQKVADRPLFEVGAQNGEIRTVRQVTDKDAVKQKLTVVVEDNGQPSRSATVNVNVAVADSFPEVLLEFTDFTHDKQYSDNLTFYLVLALAVVSFLFIACLVAIISVKIYRWRQSRVLYQSNLPVIPYYPPQYADVGGAGAGTLKHVYNYEVCMTTDSRKSDSKFLRPSHSLLMVDPSCMDTMQRAARKESVLDDAASPELVRHLPDTFLSLR